MVNIPYITNNDGSTIQAIGLGTYSSKGGDCERATLDAIDAGYRHIDTAYLYGNEAEVGRAVNAKIAEGVIKREDIFITSKLWNTFHEPSQVERACRMSLKNFGLDYVDLYLIHWPTPFAYRGDDVLIPKDADGEVELGDVDYLDTWREMEKLVGLGLVKSIGVSNFNSQQLTRLLANCKIRPIHNQVEVNPAFNQKKLIEFCKKQKIVVTAFCPLARANPEKQLPKFLFAPELKEVGAKYGKSAAQVALRYLVEIGVIPLPKSVTKHRIIENLNIFDFKLNAEDHKIIETFNTNQRTVLMLFSKKSKNYPFDLEF